MSRTSHETDASNEGRAEDGGDEDEDADEDEDGDVLLAWPRPFKDGSCDWMEVYSYGMSIFYL